MTSPRPIAPLAPGLLTMTIDCGRWLLAASAKARAIMSVPPPAANGTTSSMGLVG
jgi:hypothetical protein